MKLMNYQIDIIQDNFPLILAIMARMSGKDVVIHERITQWHGDNIIVAPALYEVSRYKEMASIFNYQQILEGIGQDNELSKAQVILIEPYYVTDKHITAAIGWAMKAKANKILIIGCSNDRGLDNKGKPKPDIIKDIWFTSSHWNKHHVSMFQIRYLDNKHLQDRILSISPNQYKYEVEASMA